MDAMSSEADLDAEHADVHEQAAASLDRYEQRYTQGRRRLVELLAGAGRPVTLPDLLGLDRSLPQSSVYRNLEVLERVGLVSRITTGPDHAHYELAEPLLGHHHHLICISCGQVTDVQLGDEVEVLVDQALHVVAERAGFTQLHHQLDLHGRCEDCTNTE